MPSQTIAFIELQTKCENQMRLDVCNGCTECFLRCAHDVPASRDEWNALQSHLAALPESERESLTVILAQDKTVDLGDDVTVQMCRYFDMNTRFCTVYPVRPLACRILGHVEWMPCPIERVPSPLPTTDALKLMRGYAEQERRIFADWETEERQD